MEQDKLLTDEQLLKAFDGAFDNDVLLYHMPTPEEIFIIRLRAVEDKVRQETLREVSEYLEKLSHKCGFAETAQVCLPEYIFAALKAGKITEEK